MYYASSTIELPDLVHGIFHSISMEKNGNGMEWNGMEMEFSIMESITMYLFLATPRFLELSDLD
jgi:hypothetical protein